MHEHVLTLNMRGAKEIPYWIDASASWGARRRGAREDAGVTAQFFPISPQLFFPILPDTVAPGPGLQLWIQEAGILPKQEAVITVLNR